MVCAAANQCVDPIHPAQRDLSACKKAADQYVLRAARKHVCVLSPVTVVVTSAQPLERIPL
jgi:hypothetical protein